MILNFNNTSKFCTKSTLFKNVVQLTKDKFSNLKRGSYAMVNSTDVDYFNTILGANNLITGEEVQSYNVDWLKSVSGKYSKLQYSFFQ